MTAPRSVVLELPHLRFHALQWGAGNPRLMLCLHGYPDTAWTWRQLGPHFAQRGFRVVAPFSRGYAPTELARDDDYSVGALMHDAITLHAALEGGADAVLVGHDWGGLTANGIAAYPGNPFGHIVSMGVPLVAGLGGRADSFTDLARRLPRQVRMSWYVLYQQLPWIPERSLGRVIPRLWRDWCPAGYDAEADLAWLWESLPDVRRRTAALSYYRAQFRPSRRGPHADLNRLSRKGIPETPMLMMHGEVDGAIDVRLAELGTRVLPAGSRHEIIDGAGHFMHLDRPDVVHRHIETHVTTA